jgi:hypothetical protein
MILSTESTTENAFVGFNTRRGRFNHLVQDLVFRIDTVENGTRGDTDDYLLKGVTQEGDETIVKLRAGGNPMQMWATMYQYGVA